MKVFNKGEYIVGRYLVTDVRTGGMGIVYFCFDDLYKMPVALKSFILEDDKDWKSILQFFIREAKTWINIGKVRHAVEAYNIVNVETKFGIIPYIAIELIEGHPVYGESVSGWIRNAALSFQLIWFLAIDICTGMIDITKKLQDKGQFVHRDLKPQNILLSREGCIKITDFGLAKLVSDNNLKIKVPNSEIASDRSFSFGSIGNVCGTPAYMSPEQCLGLRAIDQRSDVYSYGCILYEFCTKGYVFQANSAKEFIEHHIHTIHKPVERLNPDLPPFFSKLINECLAKNPEDRPKSFVNIRHYLMSELHNNDEIHREGIKFQLFGFSYLSESPRVNSNWEMNKSGQAILLGNAYGVDYVIRQGLVANKAEWDTMVLEHEKGKNKRKADSKRYEVELEIEESIKTGDAFITLVKTAADHEKHDFIQSAIAKYHYASRKFPDEAKIIFRLGLSYNLMAELFEKENKDISNDLYSLAVEEFNDCIEQSKTQTLFEFNELLYLLPYSAMFNKCIAQVCKEEYQSALENLKHLVSLLENDEKSEFKDICEEIKRNAIKATELILNS